MSKLLIGSMIGAVKRAPNVLKKYFLPDDFYFAQTLDDERLHVAGYNNWENLRESSYANITSVGKSLLTPYTSFPVAS